ncbi:unnamed protein product [Fraxinus pennsylvanica]|uniref:Prolamin-like domain-containing protein n=1 Tax=Fraxinus pennsylvanica TaxID=56036 RepID=A0AAD1ZEE7_9LAMI|nr:unnamed protein product [Fraxinus pennsylvanica]
MSNARTMQAIVLIFACISAMSAPNFAQVFGGGLPTGLLGFNSFGLPQVFRCIPNVSTAPKCVDKFLIASFNLQLELLDPECCEVFLQVDENCLSEVMMPVNPMFPSIFKNYCGSIRN